jgi:D-cysteine desulfhydrase family pyridoxal phosphate-dependent enzyme
MRLTSLPRLRLAALPTPLHRAERLSAALGGPEIWFKRDDLTGFGAGGNKIRKLEFLAADALAQDADTLVTGAGPQSNHVRMTMAVAARLGLKGVAVFHGFRPGETQGNLLLDELLGAELVFSNNPDRSQLDGRIVAEAERLQAAGRRPYVIGRGGASPLGSVGYVAASLEILNQLAELQMHVDYLFCAIGSCGTQTGLLVGARWLQPGYRVYGVTVSRPRQECLARLEKLASETMKLLELKLDLSREEIIVDENYIGAGYGLPTPACVEAIRLVAQTEGVFLDPVYSGKAMAGLIDLIRRGEIDRQAKVLFLHTGGFPSLFAYPAELTANHLPGG